MADITVTTALDVVDAMDAEMSLREAVAAAYAIHNDESSLITFDPALSGQTITLTNGELTISGNVTIDGDVDGDNVSDITVSGGGSRVINLIGATYGVTTIDALTITGGVEQRGGGVFVENGGYLRVYNSVITGNTSNGLGAGIYNEATVRLTNTVVANNSASSGGGIANDGNLRLYDSTVSDNSASSLGGGISNTGFVTITNSTISGNDANNGGGISTNNVARLYGATISGNTADNRGGGIYNDFEATLTNTTVSGNTAATQGAGIDHSGLYDLKLYNSIVVGNSTGAEIEGYGSVASYNSLTTGVAAAVFAALDGRGGGLLADNGGPVQTIALNSDAANPAIDAGDDAVAPLLDATGAARQDFTGIANNGVNISDLGAVEASAPNTPPSAQDDAFTTNAATPILASDLFADNGSGEDNDTETSFALTGINGAIIGDGETIPLPSGAFLTIRTNGSFDYSPNGAFNTLAVGQNATDTFTYTITDASGATDQATATVTVLGSASGPVAADDVFSIFIDAFVLNFFSLFFDNGAGQDLNFIGNSVSTDGFDLTEINGQPVTDGETLTLPSGALLTVQADGVIDYFDNGAFDDLGRGDTSTDSFVYTIEDAFGVTDQATATFQIFGSNNGPFASDDFFDADLDAPITIDIFENDGVLQGDAISVDGFELTLINGAPVTPGDTITLASGALLEVQPNGSVFGTFVYNPNGALDTLPGGQTGFDTFTYTIEALGVSDQGTVTLEFIGQNQPPVAAGDAFDLNENAILSDDLFADNGFGADLDVDSVFLVSSVNDGPINDGDVITLASGAFLTIRTDGTFDYDPNGQFDDLAVGETASDGFTYTIDDGAGGFDSASVTLTITGVNDAPVANDDGFSTTENALIANADLFADNGAGVDADPDGTFSVFEINGGAIIEGNILTLQSGALLTIRLNGTFDYGPNSQFDDLAVGETASDGFTYTIDDGAGGFDSALVTLTITGVNDAPVANDDGFSTTENALIANADLFADNGAGVDADPDGTFSVVEINGEAIIEGNILTLPSGALLTTRLNGTFDYDPNGQFERLSQGGLGTDSFTYTIEDEEGDRDTATAILEIIGTNDDPRATDDAFATNEDTAISGNLFDDNGFGTDADIDHAIFNITQIDGVDFFESTALTLPSGALLSVGAEGAFDYDPNEAFKDLPLNEEAIDAFTYQITDGDGGKSTAEVRITVADSGLRLITGATNDRDLLEGSSEHEEFIALAGDDLISGFGGSDSITAGEGADRARGGAGDDTINGGNGDDVLYGETGDDSISGGAGRDRIRGQLDDDTLIGGGGDDLIHGGGGDDIVVGSAGRDRLQGGRGADELDGGLGDDLIRGGRGADALNGGVGSDRLVGGGGNDTLAGGVGSDTLIGGRGDDVFVFTPNDGLDVILRFQQGQDLLDISAIADGFSEVSIAQSGDDVMIEAGDVTLIVRTATTSDFTVDDFLF